MMRSNYLNETHTINAITKNITKNKSMKICCNNIQIPKIISESNPRTITIKYLEYAISDHRKDMETKLTLQQNKWNY